LFYVYQILGSSWVYPHWLIISLPHIV